MYINYINFFLKSNDKKYKFYFFCRLLNIILFNGSNNALTGIDIHLFTLIIIHHYYLTYYIFTNFAYHITIIPRDLHKLDCRMMIDYYS